MLSLKENVISRIFGVLDQKFDIPYKSIISNSLKLGKYCNDGITFHLPKEKAKEIFGLNLPLNKIKTDSLLLNVKEESNSNIEKDSIITFIVNKNDFLKNLLSHNGNSINTNFENKPLQHVLVEFSSPNIAKPFHIGHLRSTIVGNFIANCAGKCYGKVTRLNYLGDWGTQVGYIKSGLDDLGITEEKLFADPIRILYKAYVNAHNREGNLEKAKVIFSQLEHERCEQELKDFWEKVRHESMKSLDKTYLDLGIKFDEYCYESDYKISRIKKLLENLEVSGIAKKRPSDGLLVLCPSVDKEIPLLREDGTSLYLSRDIAAAVDRLNKYSDCSNIFYVVDKSQVEHFNNVAKAVTFLTGKDVIKHVQFGRVTKVSSRKGTTLLLQDILDKAIEKMGQQQQDCPNSRTEDPEVTKVLAVSVLMIYILRQARCRNFVFNWDLAMQGKGDSGVKLQYTHSRLYSLEENCGVQIPINCEPTLINEQLLLEILVEIARCDEIVHDTINNMESSYLIRYLFKLCNLISRSLSQITVKGQPKDIAQQRLLVYHKARLILSDCMKLLGLKPLKRM